MGRETVLVDGRPTPTLAELLRPGLKAVFVGLNPSPTSVAAGHYYQGRHGRTLWKRLQKFGILAPAPAGQEDVHAFASGFGFADLVRRPTRGASDLTRREKQEAVDDLINRLGGLGDKPIIAFVYAEPAELAGARLIAEGYVVERMPGPYAPTSVVEARMNDLRSAIERGGRTGTS
ncbi:MAG: uracil-DNA glycosylase family protein [Rubrimonas sp.]|uniref:uracil-DNA glycosylase family protein n=1 Tax=Rubrimonas sp. TaxID=2036015 RepID=UPI002FDCBF25